MNVISVMIYSLPPSVAGRRQSTLEISVGKIKVNYPVAIDLRVELTMWGSKTACIFYPTNVSTSSPSTPTRLSNPSSILLPVHCSCEAFQRYLTDSGDFVFRVLQDAVEVGLTVVSSELLLGLVEKGRVVNRLFPMVARGKVFGQMHVKITLDAFKIQDYHPVLLPEAVPVAVVEDVVVTEVAEVITLKVIEDTLADAPCIESEHIESVVFEELTSYAINEPLDEALLDHVKDFAEFLDAIPISSQSIPPQPIPAIQSTPTHSADTKPDTDHLARITSLLRRAELLRASMLASLDMHSDVRSTLFSTSYLYLAVEAPVDVECVSDTDLKARLDEYVLEADIQEEVANDQAMFDQLKHIHSAVISITSLQLIPSTESYKGLSFSVTVDHGASDSPQPAAATTSSSTPASRSITDLSVALETTKEVNVSFQNTRDIDTFTSSAFTFTAQATAKSTRYKSASTAGWTARGVLVDHASLIETLSSTFIIPLWRTSTTTKRTETYLIGHLHASIKLIDSRFKIKSQVPVAVIPLYLYLDFRVNRLVQHEDDIDMISLTLRLHQASITSPPILCEESDKTAFDFSYSLTLTPAAITAYSVFYTEVWRTRTSLAGDAPTRTLLGLVKIPLHRLFDVFQGDPDTLTRFGREGGEAVYLPEGEYAVVNVLDGGVYGWVGVRARCGSWSQCQEKIEKESVAVQTSLERIVETEREECETQTSTDVVCAVAVAEELLVVVEDKEPEHMMSERVVEMQSEVSVMLSDQLDSSESDIDLSACTSDISLPEITISDVESHSNDIVDLSDLESTHSDACTDPSSDLDLNALCNLTIIHDDPCSMLVDDCACDMSSDWDRSVSHGDVMGQKFSPSGSGDVSEDFESCAEVVEEFGIVVEEAGLDVLESVEEAIQNEGRGDASEEDVSEVIVMSKRESLEDLPEIAPIQEEESVDLDGILDQESVAMQPFSIVCEEIVGEKPSDLLPPLTEPHVIVDLPLEATAIKRPISTFTSCISTHQLREVILASDLVPDEPVEDLSINDLSYSRSVYKPRHQYQPQESSEHSTSVSFSSASDHPAEYYTRQTQPQAVSVGFLDWYTKWKSISKSTSASHIPEWNAYKRRTEEDVTQSRFSKSSLRVDRTRDQGQFSKSVDLEMVQRDRRRILDIFNGRSE